MDPTHILIFLQRPFCGQVFKLDSCLAMPDFIIKYFSRRDLLIESLNSCVFKNACCCFKPYHVLAEQQPPESLYFLEFGGCCSVVCWRWGSVETGRIWHAFMMTPFVWTMNTVYFPCISVSSQYKDASRLHGKLESNDNVCLAVKFHHPCTDFFFIIWFFHELFGRTMYYLDVV